MPGVRVLVCCTRATAARAAVTARTAREAGGAAHAEVVVAEDARFPDAGVVRGLFAAAELERAIVPFALAAELARAPGPVVALAPDTRVVGALDPVLQAADGGAVVALRRLDGALAGFDDGFVLLRDTPGATLARWWCARVLADGMSERWIDRLAAVNPDVTVLSDAGCAVAAWNLDERPLGEAAAGVLTAGGAVLRWIRLTGIAEATREDDPLLRALVRAHAVEVRAEQEARPLATGALAAPPGALRLDPRLRELYRRARAEGAVSGPLEDAANARAFRAWLSGPDPDPATGGVSRLLRAVWRSHSEARRAYPDLTRRDVRDGYLGWIREHGRHDLGLARDLLPEPPPVASPAAAVRPPWGVNVAGYFRSEVGVGEAARRLVEALDAVAIPALPVQGAVLPPSRQGAAFDVASPADAPFAVNLLCVNADGLPAAAKDLGDDFFLGRYSIGLWWWEVDVFPEAYHGAFEYLDEVWTGSEHVARAIAPSSPIPVVKIAQPVGVADVEPMSRAELGLPEGFAFLFLFDYHSVFERKNPLGLVDAFTRAFPPGAGLAPSLVVKCINHEDEPEQHERLRRAAGAHPGIHLIERYVTGRERDALMASCDAYVSLHRAEGFGQTMAEAMWLGKPVIATSCSGNLEFMSDDTSWMVPWTPAPVPATAAPYPPEATWADPDLDAAAAAMREVVERPAAAAARADRGARSIRRTHSPEAAGAVMRERLAAIRDEAHGRAGRLDAEVAARALYAGRERLARIDALAADGLRGEFGPPSRNPAVRIARRALLQALRPRFGHERDLAMELRAGLADLLVSDARRFEQGRLEALARHAKTLQLLRRARS